MYIANYENTETKRDEETKRLFNTLIPRKMGADKDFSVAVERAEVGGSFPAHSHDLEQMFFVIEGKMRIRLDGEEQILGPRSIVYVPRNVSHEGWNVGDGQLEYLVIDHWPADSQDKLGL